MDTITNSNTELRSNVMKLAETAAGTKSSVLIQGENGTGKTFIAKNIHEKSARAAGPLVTVNCAQLPEMLLETEMCGFEKGAFAGTVAPKMASARRIASGSWRAASQSRRRPFWSVARRSKRI